MKNVYKQSQLFARQTIVIWILFSLFLLSSCTKEFQNEVSDEIKPKSIKEYVTEFHKDPVYMELLDVWGKSYMDNFIDSVLCGKEKTRQNKLSALTAYMKTVMNYSTIMFLVTILILNTNVYSTRHQSVRQNVQMTPFICLE